eukprot:Hpha_TRINITY_DN13602_c0_g2::TRINITY_DN13602_c0_g2_i1::g.122936::m.122936
MEVVVPWDCTRVRIFGSIAVASSECVRLGGNEGGGSSTALGDGAGRDTEARADPDPAADGVVPRGTGLSASIICDTPDATGGAGTLALLNAMWDGGGTGGGTSARGWARGARGAWDGVVVWTGAGGAAGALAAGGGG